MSNTSKELDQFYTNPKIASKLVNQLNIVAFDNVVEPSAGTGAFYSLIPNCIGLDLEPKSAGITKQDFFDFTYPTGSTLTVGNPPFGRRSSLAIDFFNKAAKDSDVIAFIIPVSWEKYEVQSKLDKGFNLVHSVRLPNNSFVFNGKPHNVNCVWQIWAKESPYDLRIRSKPALSNPDFVMYLHNATKESEAHFDRDWDFAVYRQGHKDYSMRFTQKSQLDPKQHYMLFKANTPAVLKRLSGMDYKALSYQTITPGFGKADLVKKYEETL